jgi:glycosyl transferase family 87
VRGRRADVAYFAALAVGLVVLLMYGLVSKRMDMLGVDDFSTIWAGPRAFLLGADPYDAATWADTAVRVGTHVPDTAVYLYPPWIVIGLLPLALLPVNLAGAIWTVGGMIAAVAATRGLLRAYLPGVAWAHGVFGLLLLISAPAAVALLTGQWPYFQLAALATIVLLLRADRPIAAGLVAVVMLTKPPLFIFTAAALSVQALWPGGASPGTGRRFVGAAISAGVVTVAASWLLIPGWWSPWLQHVAGAQLGTQPVTLATLLTTFLGSPGVWLAPVVLLAGVLAALQFHPRGRGWLPVWTALSSAGTVYSNTYDLLLLILPLILASGAVWPRSPRRAAGIVAVGGTLLVFGMWYLHTINVRLYAEIVPLAVFVLVVATLWPERRVTVDAAAPRRPLVSTRRSESSTRGPAPETIVP